MLRLIIEPPLPYIPSCLVSQKADCVAFLHDDIAAVAFIAANPGNGGSRPFQVSLCSGKRKLGQYLGDFLFRVPGQEQIVNETNRPCSLRLNHHTILTVFLVPQKILRWAEIVSPVKNDLKPKLHRPGLQLAVQLREHGKHRQNDLVSGFQCVQVVVLKIDSHGRVQRQKLLHCVQAIRCVSGKARYILDDNQVDAPRSAGFNHLAEAGSVPDAGSADAVVKKYADVFPIRMLWDELFVILLLVFQAVLLILAVG